MKNSLTRLLQQHRNRFSSRAIVHSGSSAGTAAMLTGAKVVGFAGLSSMRQPSLTEEMRQNIKSQLMQLIQNPDDVILSKNSYDQLTLVANIFIKYDFPANWVEMNTWLL